MGSYTVTLKDGGTATVGTLSAPDNYAVQTSVSVGYPGYTGSVGAIGYTGSRGDTGYTGSVGAIGYTGSRGDTGYTGSVGAIGYTGSRGSDATVNVNAQYVWTNNQTFNANVSLTSGTITNTPVYATDIVNKTYADAIATGVNFHPAVRLTTTVSFDSTTATYYNGPGANGVGATITDNAPYIPLSLDGVSAAYNDRILMRTSSNTAWNGIYTVSNTGSASYPWVLTRSYDYDLIGAGTNEIDVGDLIYVTAGSTLAGTSWVQQQIVTSIGTDPMTFVQFSSKALYALSAGDGLSYTVGGTYDGSAASTIAVNSSYIATLTSNNSTNFGGYTWASPAALGATVANSASFTTVNATSYAVGSAFVANSTGITTTGTLAAGNTGVTGILSFTDRIQAVGPSTSQSGYADLSSQINSTQTGQQNMVSVQGQVSPQGAGTLNALYGLLFLPTIVSSANNITNIYPVFGRVDSASSYTGTVTNLNTFTAATPSWGSATAISNIYHYTAENATATTSVIGFRGQVTSGTGKWNFYASGAASNYFLGQVTIGSTNLTNGFLGVAGTQSSATAMAYIGGLNQSANAAPSALLVSSQLTGSATTITSAYGIQINTGGVFANTIATYSGVHVNPVLAGANTPTNYYGIFSQHFYSAAALGGTVALAANYIAATPSINAATTTNITTQVGFRASSMANGALNTITNIYAFQGLQNSSAFSNAYNLFMNGNAANYIAGNVGIANTLPNATLAITGTANVSGVVTFGSTLTVTGNVTTSGYFTGNTGNNFAIGYRDRPQNFTNTSFTFAIGDAGKHILTQNSGTASQTITIPNTASVAYQTGATIDIIVQSTGTVVLANGVGVTMYLAGNSTAKSTITLNTYSQSTVMKIGADTWFVRSTSAV